MHEQEHPLSGKTVILNESTFPDERNMIQPGAEFVIDDWVDRKSNGRTIVEMAAQDSSMAAINYLTRIGRGALIRHFTHGETAYDSVSGNEVYGRIGPFTFIINDSEIGGVWD